MNKKLLYAIIAVAVLGTGGYFLLFNGNGKDFKYRTEKASRGDVTVQVRATGTINPIQTVRVGSQVSGTISQLYADFNSEVKKGQVVAIIDSTFLSASVKEAEANVERNQAQVNEAKRTLARTTELFKKDLVSQADLDAAQTAYESAVATSKQARAALDRAQVNLRFAVIRAPIDGVVISRDVDVGQTVAASLSAPQIFSIANDLKLMRVEASVDEADIGQVKAGQDVTFTVDSYPDEKFHGTVSQVRLAPVTAQNVVTYTVIIDVPNDDLKLRPGMTATVAIMINQRKDVLRVSSIALRFQPPAEVLEELEAEKAQEEEKGAKTAEGAKQGDASRQTSQSDSSGGRRGMRNRGEGGSERRANREGAEESNRGQTGQGMRSSGQGGGGGMRGGRGSFGRIWVLENGKTLKSLMVRTGLTDNRYIEIVGGGLKEGDEVILGVTSGETASTQQGNNPFAPRMQGGPGGRMR